VNNYAYIDNQNLYMATKFADEPWLIDMKRFRVYLAEKYHVSKAYLFMGAYNPDYKKRYSRYAEYGYELVFRPHSSDAHCKKKGNVDTDVVFYCMRDVFTDESLDKVLLISRDGDFFRMAEYLSTMGKLEKVLLPSHKNASSLYKKLSRELYVYLDNPKLNKRFKLENK
jgi:uncharacterized LabA/DUF88 family protein